MKRNMNHNQYLHLWIPMMLFHALHQIEESISFFGWYIDHASKIPDWLLITSIENAKTIVQHPEYFIVASFAQLFFVALIAFIARHDEHTTRIFQFLYLSGLTFFMVWHIIISYLAQSYAPIMVTSIGGLSFIYIWFKKMLIPNTIKSWIRF